jgi:predicted peroxiredoxin
MCCSGSPVIDVLKTLMTRGVELVLCQTCLVTFDLEDQVQVGIVGGMGDILETLQMAEKVVSL